jgi:hypothetical protein
VRAEVRGKKHTGRSKVRPLHLEKPKTHVQQRHVGHAKRRTNPREKQTQEKSRGTRPSYRWCAAWRRDRSASWASCAAWKEAEGRPSREAARVSGVRAERACNSLPWMDSVRRDAQAMEAVQPRHRKRTSRMEPFSMMAASWRTSPQTGLATSILTLAAGSSPALRGCWKCSRSVWLNIGRIMAAEGAKEQTQGEGFNAECAVKAENAERRNPGELA